MSYSTTPKYAQGYFAHLRACLGLKDGFVYPKNISFESEHILTLTPEDIVSYFNLKVFGTTDPDEDCTPKLGRSSSLLYYKKAISFFMPNKLLGWNVQSSSENPTKSVLVNNIINKVKKMEVRKQGKESQARRPLTIDEFKYTIRHLKAGDDDVWRYALPALCSFQFHLIARIDDTCQFMMNELVVHDLFPFALRGRMRWSKNVLEERHCPSQIILGSNDPDFCVLLNVGVYLEHMFPTEMNDEGLVTCFSIAKKSYNTKKRAGKILSEIFTSDDFETSFGDGRTSVGNVLGSHSLRKCAATHARRNGCSRDEIDLRGRWKHLKRQVDTYLDTSVPYPDAKVCTAICIGGAIKYAVRKGAGIDDAWILKNVVPNIAEQHSCLKAASVLGRAIMWACFDPLASLHVPSSILERVKSQYARICTLDPTLNPIRKVGFVVCGHEGQLYIDNLVVEDEEEVACSNDEPSLAGITDLNRKRKRQSAELQAVLSQLSVLRKQNEVLSEELSVLKTHLSKKLKYMADTLNRIAAIPAQITRIHNLTNTNPSSSNSTTNCDITGTEREQGAYGRVALCRNPKSLYVLWNEYEFGVSGCRPAKTFSRNERGIDRYTYYRRNIFWGLVVEMIKRGRSANESIDKIYQVYGYKTSVTNIIKKLQEEKKNHFNIFL